MSLMGIKSFIVCKKCGFSHRAKGDLISELSKAERWHNNCDGGLGLHVFYGKQEASHGR